MDMLATGESLICSRDINNHPEQAEGFSSVPNMRRSLLLETQDLSCVIDPLFQEKSFKQDFFGEMKHHHSIDDCF
jgi:hypothetical protein